MFDNNNTQEQKLVLAVELSDAEMEKVSGGVEGSGGYQPSNGGLVGYGSYNGVEGSGGYQPSNGGFVGYGSFADSSSS